MCWIENWIRLRLNVYRAVCDGPYRQEGVRQHEAGGHPGGGGFPGGGFGGGQQFTFNFGGGGGGGGRGRGGRQRDPFEMFNTMFGDDGGGGPRRRRQGSVGQDEERPKDNLFAKDSAVSNLKQGKFPGTDAKHVWIIEFYAPWCGHCRQVMMFHSSHSHHRTTVEPALTPALGSFLYFFTSHTHTQRLTAYTTSTEHRR